LPGAVVIVAVVVVVSRFDSLTTLYLLPMTSFLAVVVVVVIVVVVWCSVFVVTHLQLFIHCRWSCRSHSRTVLCRVLMVNDQHPVDTCLSLMDTVYVSELVLSLFSFELVEQNC